MFEKYTAKDYREAAKTANDWGFLTTAEMLRQAAELMEREVKYEYAEEFIIDGGLYFVYHHRTDSLAYAKEVKSRDTKLVRRPVGEWEEVKE